MGNRKKNNVISISAAQSRKPPGIWGLIMFVIFAAIFTAELCGPVLAAAINGCNAMGDASVIAAIIVSVISAGAVAVLFKLLLEKIKLPVWASVAALVIIAVIAALLMNRAFRDGASLYLNGFLYNWNLKTGAVVYYRDFGDGSATFKLSLFMGLVSAVITLVLEILFYYRRRIELLVFNFLFFAAAVVLLPGMNAWPAICSGLAMLLYIVYCGSETGFLKGNRIFTGVAALIAAAVIALVTIAASVIPGSLLAGPQASLLASLESFRFGKTDLSEGDLRNAGARNTSRDERLEVSVSGENLSSEEEEHMIYLRGFVGSVYNGSGWEDLDDSAYQGSNLAMLQWLTENNDTDPEQDFIPLSSSAQALKLSDRFAGQKGLMRYDLSDYSYEIKNTGASSKYIYLPSGCTELMLGRGTDEEGSELVAGQMNKDINVKNSILGSADNYSVQTAELPADDYIYLVDNNSLTDEEYQKRNEYFILREQTYSDFVDECYNYDPEDGSHKFYDEATLPEEIAEYFDNDNSISRGSREGASQIIWDVREFLEYHIVYSDSPASSFGKRSASSDDYVINLLDNDRQGYSVQYATVATLLFRYLGMPARYVEGYLVKTDGGQAGNGLFTVRASDAHAWVEVYRYGFGWVPVDVTPGYYDIPEERQLIQKETSQEESDTSEAEGSEENEREEDEDTHSGVNIFWLIVLLVILAAVIGFFLIRNVIVMSSRKRKMQSSDYASNIRLMAGLIVKNASLGGFSLRKDLPSNDSRMMNEFTGGGVRFEETAAAVAHAFYSPRGADKTDADIVEKYLDATVKTIYEPAGFFKKLKLKYIDLVC